MEKEWEKPTEEAGGSARRGLGLLSGWGREIRKSRRW